MSVYDGWDVLERFTWREIRADEDQREGTTIELGPDAVSTALLFELQRPPWWRDLDKERKAIAQELAA